MIILNFWNLLGFIFENKIKLFLTDWFGTTQKEISVSSIVSLYRWIKKNIRLVGFALGIYSLIYTIKNFLRTCNFLCKNED